MTLEQNITVIINKLKSMSGKMLSIEKKLKSLERLEPNLNDALNRIVRLEDGLADIEVDIAEGKLLPETTITVGDFQPNEKFLGWYTGVFADEILESVGEDILKEVPEETQEVEEEATKDENSISVETLEKLDEVVNDG